MYVSTRIIYIILTVANIYTALSAGRLYVVVQFVLFTNGTQRSRHQDLTPIPAGTWESSISGWSVQEDDFDEEFQECVTAFVLSADSQSQ